MLWRRTMRRSRTAPTSARPDLCDRPGLAAVVGEGLVHRPSSDGGQRRVLDAVVVRGPESEAQCPAGPPVSQRGSHRCSVSTCRATSRMRGRHRHVIGEPVHRVVGAGRRNGLESNAPDLCFSRALKPAVRGHNTNLGVDRTNVDDLGDQVDGALALKPLPDLFMIKEVDNDMQCDGTDPDNYPRFAKTMPDQLVKITAKAPRATILLVSSPPGTVANYGTIASHLPAAKAASTGTGPCDLFGPSGRAVPKHWRYQDQVTRAYQARLAAVCKQVPTCRYDGGALYRMVISAEDLAGDGLHLSVAGHRKQAALERRVLGLDS